MAYYHRCTAIPPARHVWRHHDFRWLAVGQGLSWFGDGFMPVALAVGLLAHGGSASDLGVVLAIGMGARLVCTLIGGVWADRLAPQRIMVVADLVRMAAAAGLATLFASGQWTVWAVAGLVALAMAAGSFFTPAFTALKPTLVPPDERQASNGMLTILKTGAQLAGPTVAGAVVALWGAPVGFAVNAASFIVSAVCVVRVRARPERAVRTGFASELAGGLTAIRSRPWLRAGIVGASLYHLGNGVVLVLIPVLAMRELGGAHAVGLVESAAGLGGLLGGLFAMRVRVRRPLLLAWPMLTVLPLGLLTYVWPTLLLPVLAGTVVGFVALMFLEVLWETTVQAHVAADQLARVASWDVLASFVMLPLGNTLAGPLADRFGAGPTMAVACGWMVLAALSPLLTRGTWQVALTPEVSERRTDDVVAVGTPGG
ncbi:MFS transporter [Luteipulveratus halotolerans]|uniref:MFS transporter n=1 Tax=Luteipulveratus halotolerans TaxID=1631356 RepID=A0A0L6CIH9_9MICO|nr:MFS transporter [Luteipulveratus halotolerans]KNX37602.1 hypothetical protein VV01_11325 [Luteipulveratus halotolerans]